MIATILVVDDSNTMRLIVKTALTQAGWHVLTAVNGREALDLARERQIDLLVCDWNMPVMGGLDLIQALREDSRHSQMPVLVLTTENDVDSKTAARHLGVCGWLNKPVEPNTLVELIAELLDEQALG